MESQTREAVCTLCELTTDDNLRFAELLHVPSAKLSAPHFLLVCGVALLLLLPFLSVVIVRICEVCKNKNINPHTWDWRKSIYLNFAPVDYLSATLILISSFTDVPIAGSFEFYRLYSTPVPFSMGNVVWIWKIANVLSREK